jgi:hypothetical protein
MGKKTLHTITASRKISARNQPRNFWRWKVAYITDGGHLIGWLGWWGWRVVDTSLTHGREGGINRRIVRIGTRRGRRRIIDFVRIMTCVLTISHVVGGDAVRCHFILSVVKKVQNGRIWRVLVGSGLAWAIERVCTSVQ